MKKFRHYVLGTMLVVAMSSSTILATPAQAPETTTSAPTKTMAPEEKKEESLPKETFVIDNFKIIQATLEKLGIKPMELEKMIKEGKTLQGVLEEKKIPIKKFKKAVLKEYNKVIDQGVENKQITAEQGDTLKQAIKEKVMTWLCK